MGRKLNRRRLMGTSAAALGAAALAGGHVASVTAGMGYQGKRVVRAQDGGKEFHSSWPYLDPGSGGHFNSFVTDAILPGNNIYGDMIRSPLGLYYWEADEWLPLLATDWRFIQGEATPVASGGEASPVAGGTGIFEVKLREDAVWSDGTPFTATDVVDTLWCYRIMSNSLWSYIDDAVAVDDYTVHCSMFKPSTVVERYVIRQAPPVPSSVYGEWAQRARDVFGGGKTTDDPEGAQLLDEFNQFRPELPPATGPYQIDEASITNAQMTLVKNETSVFADVTPFDRIINFNGETDTISAVALNKDIDYATQAFAPATEQELIANGIRIVRPPVYSGPALLMNFGTLGEVFGDKRVRQALAHVIDGDQIGFFALADSGVPVIHNVGFSDNIIGNWLSQEAIDGLNQYQTDLDLATQMLTEAGWSKEGDTWKTQTGEDASFELIFPAEFADWSAAGQALAAQLTDFGVPIEPRAVTFTQQPIDVDEGTSSWRSGHGVPVPARTRTSRIPPRSSCTTPWRSTTAAGGSTSHWSRRPTSLARWT
jgi:peptide/nickel transport system substrate-binding protein